MIGKGKRKQKQQAASQQYIYQYKIQYILPNTFTNKESIAQEDSLHNQLKNFISYPLIVWGGEGGRGGGFINHFPSLFVFTWGSASYCFLAQTLVATSPLSPRRNDNSWSFTKSDTP